MHHEEKESAKEIPFLISSISAKFEIFAVFRNSNVEIRISRADQIRPQESKKPNMKLITCGSPRSLLFLMGHYCLTFIYTLININSSQKLVCVLFNWPIYLHHQASIPWKHHHRNDHVLPKINPRIFRQRH